MARTLCKEKRRDTIQRHADLSDLLYSRLSFLRIMVSVTNQNAAQITALMIGAKPKNRWAESSAWSSTHVTTKSNAPDNPISMTTMLKIVLITCVAT